MTVKEIALNRHTGRLVWPGIVRWQGATWVAVVILGVLTGARLARAQTNVSLEFVSQWRPAPGHSVRDVSIVGNHAFVAGLGGLHILDISDPRNPTRIGGNELVEQVPYAIQVAGNQAFVAGYRGLQILDVSDLQTPQVVGSVTNWDLYDVEVVGQLAYVADFYHGLKIYDVSDPTNPTLLSTFSIPGNASSVRVAGDHVYVAAYFSGMQIVNVSNPTQPVLAGSFNDDGGATASFDAEVFGTHAFVANITRGLKVVDVSDPAQPRLLATLPIKGGARGVRAAGSRVFVTEHAGGVRVVDVSEPTRPVLVGSFSLGGTSDSVQVLGSHAYVASDEFVILKVMEQALGFSEQPKGLQIDTGQTAVFTASAVSPVSFTYQWRKDGSSLADDGRIVGASTSTLAISNATAADQGCYSVVISNGFGSVTSSDACLTVRPGLREALDDTNLVWSMSPAQGWSIQSAVTHDGVDAAQGGPIQAGIIAVQTSLSTSVTGPGTVSFWWKLQYSSCFRLQFSVGGNLRASLGSPIWTQQTLVIPPGPQNLRWTFLTLCGDGSPPGSAWLDEVQFTSSAPPQILEQPQDVQVRWGQNATVAVNATGPGPLAYQWFLGQSGDANQPISGATNSALALTNLMSNADYWVRVTNAFGAAESRTASISVVSALAVLVHDANSLTIELTGSAGTRVQLEFSSDLISWETFPVSPVTLSTGRHVLQLPASDSRAFFRVLTVP